MAQREDMGTLAKFLLGILGVLISTAIIAGAGAIIEGGRHLERLSSQVAALIEKQEITDEHQYDVLREHRARFEDHENRIRALERR